MCRYKKIKPLRFSILIFLGVGFLMTGSVSASQLVPQTWFDAASAYTANAGPLFPLFQSNTTTLPIFGPGYNRALPRVDAVLHPFLTINMVEKSQQVLPAPFGPTRLWTYEVEDSFTHQVLAPAWWPGVTVETERLIPTIITYQNKLPSFGRTNPVAGMPGTGLLQGLVSIDQTIHWADPFNPGPRFGMMGPCMDNPSGSYKDKFTGKTIDCNQPWIGPIAVVPHLHGAEITSYYDGGPDGWFTMPFGKYPGINGSGYSTFGALFGGARDTGYTSGPLCSPVFSKWLGRQSFAKPGPGKATYLYDNAQEPGTLWFHDHQMGGTRTNVVSGLQAFYFIRGPLLEPYNLPNGAYEIEMAIQDRQFDTTGQLFWPDGSSSGTGASLAACGSGLPGDPCLNGPPPNPSLHPIWIPEFIGDVAMVNGAPWPVMQVEPRRYLFRILDGSNARAYNLTFGDKAGGEAQPGVYVIGNDDNYLNAPAKSANTFNPVFNGLGPAYTQNVFIAPGQREYLVVDFTGMANGSTVTVLNDAPVPFPSGLSPVAFSSTACAGGVCPADQPQMSKIMQFKVNVPLRSADRSCNPATGGCTRPTKVVSLAGVTDNGSGHNVVKKRELVLKEFEGSGQFGAPGGPAEVLVQNSKYDGTMSPGLACEFPLDGMSELPRDGSIEEWTFVNLTPDAHPMHTHLVQFQILSRQDFDTDGTTPAFQGSTGYFNAWGNAFLKKGSYECANQGSPLVWPNPDPVLGPQNPCPGWGPPLPYNRPNGDGAIGGNPAVGPYLIHSPVPPPAWENGWRDTAVAYPGQILRVLARWTPTSVRQSAGADYTGHNYYSFDPTAGPGYVWHCHIVDHEDNEMMRPYRVSP